MLTVLLVPSAGDMRLLADDPGGGRVPWAHQTWREDYGNPDGGTWSEEWTLGDADTSHEPVPHTALLLIHEDAVVPLGWDRFRRVYRGGGAAPFANPSLTEVVAYANIFARDTGARLVVLRDGRHVN